MKLYVFKPSPNCRKATSILCHTNSKDKVEIKWLDVPKGEHKNPEIGALNPNMYLPVVEDQGRGIWDSNTVMIYLAQKFGANDLWPQDEAERCNILKWMFWQAADWHPPVVTIIMENFVKDALFGMGGPDANVVVKATEDFHARAKVLDAHLSKNQFVSGSNMSLADVSLSTWLMYKDPGKLPVDQYSNIMSWFGRIQETNLWKGSDPEKI